MKIADFGLSRATCDKDYYRLQGAVSIAVYLKTIEATAMTHFARMNFQFFIFSVPSQSNGLLRKPFETIVTPQKVTCQFQTNFFREENNDDQTITFSPPSRWSFGVLLWEILTLGETPYGSTNMSPDDLLNFFFQGNRLPIPDACPSEV
jgi:Protein tyrosine and serine/threonine kinase